MKIIISAGYQAQDRFFDENVWLDYGTGGTEFCIIKLSKSLAKLGHEVVVTGYVKTTTMNDGVKYIHYDALSEADYDVAIGANYLSFIKELKHNKNIKATKWIFWMHNDEYYNWFRGTTMPNWVKYFDEIDCVVGVSQFHANILKEKAVELFGYVNRDVNPYIRGIDNALDNTDWVNYKHNKVKGRIIWSSSPDRGLRTLLDNWDKFKAIMPDATLNVCSPPYAETWSDRDYSQLDGVTWVGSLNHYDLRQQISEAEYWIYSSDYLETYCITALEMLRGKVKIITNGTGNISNITQNYGVTIETLDDILMTLHLDQTDKAFAHKFQSRLNLGQQYAIRQDWDLRVHEWIKLFENLGVTCE